MLEMIFANSDIAEYNYYLNSNEKQNNYRENPSPKYHVEINECMHQVSININDDEPDWGYYVDLDTSTPPKVMYSKNINISPNTLNLPKKNYIKQINYMPIIEEEILYHTNNHHNSNNIKSYMVDETSTTSSVISGVTFCATLAFYYFYRSMRN